ncbi:hypothetical protein D3C71_1611490 [compost metagenome]
MAFSWLPLTASVLVSLRSPAATLVIVFGPVPPWLAVYAPAPPLAAGSHMRASPNLLSTAISWATLAASVATVPAATPFS